MENVRELQQKPQFLCRSTVVGGLRGAISLLLTIERRGFNAVLRVDDMIAGLWFQWRVRLVDHDIGTLDRVPSCTLVALEGPGWKGLRIAKGLLVIHC